MTLNPESIEGRLAASISQFDSGENSLGQPSTDEQSVETAVEIAHLSFINGLDIPTGLKYLEKAILSCRNYPCNLAVALMTDALESSITPDLSFTPNDGALRLGDTGERFAKLLEKRQQLNPHIHRQLIFTRLGNMTLQVAAEGGSRVEHSYPALL